MAKQMLLPRELWTINKTIHNPDLYRKEDKRDEQHKYIKLM